MTAPDPEYVALKTQLAALADGDPAAETMIEELHAVYVGLLRGALTPDGYPFPDPTDPIAEGADAIRSLAEALHGRTVTTLSFVPTAAMSPNAYPEGWSIRQLSSAEATAGGWLRSGGISSVMTYRGLNTSAAFQFQYRGANDVNFQYLRGGNVNGWAAWRNAAGPFGVASGVATLPSAAANTGTSTVSVTFPSGTFTSNPAVITNSRTSVPSQRATVAGSVTTTSFVITFQNLASTASGTNSDWIAVQVDGAATPVAAALARFVAAADNPPTGTAVVICPTDGCANEGIPLEVTTEFTNEEGETVTVGGFVCGVCGTELQPETEAAE